MTMIAATFFGVFGFASILGGVLGYKKAGSRASLVAGIVTGTLLLCSAGLLASGAVGSGLLIGAVTSTLLAGRFVPTFIKTRKWMPHGMMAALSTAGLVVAVVTKFAH